jgi:hypothetical protein
LSTSITTAGPSEDSWSTRFSQPLPLAHSIARLRHCPALPGFVLDRTCRARIHSHHRIPTGTPAPPVTRKTVAWLDQAPTQHHAALFISLRALLSPTRRTLCLLAICASPPVTLLDLAASATVSAPSPCDSAANTSPVDDLFT